MIFGTIDWQTVLQIALGVFVGLPLLMLILYTVAVQGERPNLPTPIRWLCNAAALIGLVLDVLLNWTLFGLYFGEWPQRHPNVRKTEWTLTERLERLVFDLGWRGKFARAVAMLLNAIAPGHDHVRNMRMLQDRANAQPPYTDPRSRDLPGSGFND